MKNSKTNASDRETERERDEKTNVLHYKRLIEHRNTLKWIQNENNIRRSGRSNEYFKTTKDIVPNDECRK